MDLKTDVITIRMPTGTLVQIQAVLKGGEIRSAFIRAAIEAELRRREAERRRSTR